MIQTEIRSGLINPKIYSKPHRCPRPGFFSRFYNGVSRGSLWRCYSSECGKVWIWSLCQEIEEFGFYNYSCWLETDLDAWKRAGGVE